MECNSAGYIGSMIDKHWYALYRVPTSDSRLAIGSGIVIGHSSGDGGGSGI